MLAFQSAILFQAGNTAFSTWATAPAYGTAQVLSGIIGGIIKIPIAKVLNLWGRTEGYLIMFLIYEIGIIVLASSSDPYSYAAGYTLFLIGYDALYMILDIFIADTSSLRIRAFTWAFANTPFIATAFIGPLAAQSFLQGQPWMWRWAIGSFAIIQPVVFMPLAVVFKFYQRKAAKMGLFVRQPSGRTVWQSIVHYFHEFDVIGCILIIASFVLFLLPFALVAQARNTLAAEPNYSSPLFIAMVVAGVCLFPIFIAWERFFARVQFMRWELLKNRTILGSCVVAFVLYFNFYAWDNTLFNFLLIVYRLNLSDAGYVLQIYNVGSCFWGPIFGLWVYYTCRFKRFSLLFGAPIYILGTGLMIYFRTNEGPLGYLIMCQIFIAFGGGTLVIAEQLAVMAASDRDGIPLMLSLIYTFTSVGGAVGSAVAVSIYSNVWPSAWAQSIPGNSFDAATTAFAGGYLTQTEYAIGSPEQIATNFAWSRTQYYQCIAATAVFALAFPAIFAWKNYNVDRKQNKGTMI
jgi:MFS family permease